MNLTDFMVNDESVDVFLNTWHKRATAEIIYKVDLDDPDLDKHRGYFAKFIMDMALSLNNNIEYSEVEGSYFAKGSAHYLSVSIKEYYGTMVK